MYRERERESNRVHPWLKVDTLIVYENFVNYIDVLSLILFSKSMILKKNEVMV